jgi:hypothetical protein
MPLVLDEQEEIRKMQQLHSQLVQLNNRLKTMHRERRHCQWRIDNQNNGGGTDGGDHKRKRKL